jgi:hypothetical protein
MGRRNRRCKDFSKSSRSLIICQRQNLRRQEVAEDHLWHTRGMAKKTPYHGMERGRKSDNPSEEE